MKSRRLNSGNARYHSVQNLLSSRLISKSLKIKLYKTVILPVVLYGGEVSLWGTNTDWGFLITECWGGYLDLKKEEDGSWRKLHNDELHSLYSSPNIVRVIKSRRMRWAGHVARTKEKGVFTGFWLGGPKGRDHWEDLGVGGRITLRCTLGR
jgi:hypothetical protein